MAGLTPAKILQSTGSGYIGTSVANVINSDDIVEGKVNRFWHGQEGEFIDRTLADQLYVHNCLSAYQGDGSGLYVYQGIFSNSINILQTDSQSDTGLYNYQGNLYWNGTPLVQNSFTNIKNELGTVEITASSPTDGLGFAGTGGLTVSFDPSSKTVTYGIGSITAGSTYHYGFSLPENVYNCQKYFYYGAKQIPAGVQIRSGSASGYGEYSSSSPAIMPATGTISEALLKLGNAAVNDSSVTYPVHLVCNLIKQSYDGQNNSTYQIVFEIGSQYQIGSFAIIKSDILVETTGLSIPIAKGDMVSLEFIPDGSTYGASSTISLLGEAFVSVSLST